MFSIFKANPVKKLEKRYYDKLEQALHAQRNGDIRLYSELTEEAAEIKKQVDALKPA